MSTYNVFSNFSNGYVLEVVAVNKTPCESVLLLPAENLWNPVLRGILYLLGLIYLFLGVALASDVFMSSIEVITSRKRIIVRWDEEKQEKVEREVLFWNETVANLTLMALGSSAPEIMLAVIETVIKINSEEVEDALGTFTIIGSAAFNLLIITAICIQTVPKPEVKSIKELGVFMLTAVWSVWAYVWMLLVVSYISPNFVDPWEAWVTLLFLPTFVIMAYCQDNGWWCKKRKVEDSDDEPNVRVLAPHTAAVTGHVNKELHTLEQERAHRMSITSIRSHDKGSEKTDTGAASDSNARSTRKDTKPISRARFRHAAVSALTGGTKAPVPLSKEPRLLEIVNRVKLLNDAAKQGKQPEGDLLGKFTFASDRYAVLESAGSLEVDLLFHRHLLSGSRQAAVNILNAEKVAFKNGSAVPHSPQEDSNSNFFGGVVTVEYETREGSGKAGKDYCHTSGKLTFLENEYKKTISIPILNDNQYEADVDFYIILKNPTGGGGLGDPSVTRVTIVDDDEPGEFLFDETHYHADMKAGTVMAKIVREHGFDGKVTLEYSTIDGTAVGGSTLGPNVDYISAHGTITFEHAETSKYITVQVNKEAKGSKNFIITIRNPSLGAKIGHHSAVVCYLNKADELMERIAEVIEEEKEEEKVTWATQFASAMSVGGDTDDEGNTVYKWHHYLMHFFTFFWKIVCACIPPPTYFGAFPTFILSLILIGMITAAVQQLAGLLGCVLNMETSLTGITLIALGTSLPDTFASKTAARQDEHADAAIGNITGSNSVNVFLGLGLPWVISTMYALARGRRYEIKSSNLTVGVIIFGITAFLCIGLLLLRRKFVGGELGGKNQCVKWASSIFLVILWCVYIVLSGLLAYNIISF